MTSKCGDAVQTEPPSCEGGNQDDAAEEDARSQVSHVEGGRGEVSERGAEGEGREYVASRTRPSLRRDAVDGQRALAALHSQKIVARITATAGSSRRRDMDVQMQEIGHTSPVIAMA